MSKNRYNDWRDVFTRAPCYGPNIDREKYTALHSVGYPSVYVGEYSMMSKHAKRSAQIIRFLEENFTDKEGNKLHTFANFHCFFLTKEDAQFFEAYLLLI